MDFNINRAARIMRAGNEFSETNKKLREAVYSFIEWLFQALGEYEFPGEELGWTIEKKNNQIRIGFRMNVGGWHSVIVSGGKMQMNSIVLLCQALAGPEGDTLLTWLEKQAQERDQFLAALESGIQTFRSLAAEQR